MKINKQEFLAKLKKGLSGLPQSDIDERLAFYEEMIDDRIEDGLSEEDAVNEIGDIDEIISQIISETPLTKIVKEKIKPKRTLRAWEIILLILGSPLWISLLAATFIVVLSIYLVLWSLILCLWSIEVSLWAYTLCGIVSGIVIIFNDNVFSGLALIGIALVCAGLSIFLFFGCKAATKGTLLLTKKITRGIKNIFMKKEEA